MLAGPTELIILCAESFSPHALAWDLFSQAEHDEMAMVGLFSPSEAHIGEVQKAIDNALSSNPRKEVIEKALKENGFLVLYGDRSRAVEAINMIAPEHMELLGLKKKRPIFSIPASSMWVPIRL